MHYNATNADALEKDATLLLLRIAPHLPTADTQIDFDDTVQLRTPAKAEETRRRSVVTTFSLVLQLLDTGALDATQTKPCTPPATRADPHRMRVAAPPPARPPARRRADSAVAREQLRRHGDAGLLR